VCGIAGYFTIHSRRSKDESTALAAKMADAMEHRGPDSSGVWVDEGIELALAHRRLSIIDLSINGSQPMHSRRGLYVIVFNGEIYNHRELRQELVSLGEVFRGHSDTEVILAGCETWGVERTIKRCVGMFAIALWDVRAKELHLIRDRMGEKPLYYGWQKDTFLFSSELKAMRKHPDFQGEIDRNALSLYFRHRYIPTPYSIYRNVHKLEPGTILRVPIGTAFHEGTREDGEKRAYWSLKEAVEEGDSKAYEGTVSDAVSALEALLIQSIQGQMIADVPLGAFLSGGIDSSTVVALMQKLSTQPVNTFCIGFQEKGFDEAVDAKRVAQYLGCNHTELYVTPRQARETVPVMPQLYDEPFADPSQLPTFLVSQLARKDVTVSLSGDGGDELFYGYRTYSLLSQRWKIARWTHIEGRLVQNAVLKLLQWIWKADQRRLAVARSLLVSHTDIDLYRSMVSIISDPCGLVPHSHEPATVLTAKGSWPNIASRQNRVMALDALSYLPDDVLVKVDRAAMACSLETRIPLLDHRIVEFAFRLPFDVKFHQGITKWPLRQILFKHVPPRLVERPKKGFSLPLAGWLRGELKEWMRDSLHHDTIREDGILDVGTVEGYLSEHLSGRWDHSEILWNLLMFQCWLRCG
jgi:asparagine synthase (glutamine-hydrolysing)